MVEVEPVPKHVSDTDRGVNTKEEVDWYRGKRMAYIYKAKVKKNGSQYRCIWGKLQTTKLYVYMYRNSSLRSQFRLRILYRNRELLNYEVSF
ncbi:60S ribosomal protein L35a-3 [Camellia lanceoleosa]|uniref:60S ribosomal protein L35a-3 n=1 Tax=Camellia lanceoleosa TaxID=1840588 RepID=A0ACC0HRK1_9ERIC|nr:60S ribosomal protein L35a-3 [Camellia lanceoleosa]